MGRKEETDMPAEDDAMHDLVAALAQRRRPAIVLSGAGISVSSDIPAFRGDEGLWARYDPREYATIDAFRSDPEKVWEMLWELDTVLEAAEPNPAHHAIAELQRLGVVSTVITQNVDALHQEAGSRDVVELHGSRRSLTCLACGRVVTRDEVVDEATRGEVPRCRACGGELKPDVVLFGEPLPAEALDRAEREVCDCDDLLVVGTAAEVAPAAALPVLARRSGARVWEINPHPVLPDAQHIDRPAQTALPELVERLRAQDHGDGGSGSVDPFGRVARADRIEASMPREASGRGDRRRWTPRGLDRFEGMIAAGAFASGDQVVVGMWRDSPLGAFIDVMWVRPDGERVLLAPSPVVAEFVGGLYTFDRTEVVEVAGGWDGGRVEVRAGSLELRLVPHGRSWRSWIFALRPRMLRRSPAWLSVEDRLVEPLGGLLLGGAAGVRVTGITPSGRREWYSIDDYRAVAEGTLHVEGRPAGGLTDLRADLGVGLSAFPTRPALVNLVTLIEAR